MPTHHDIQEGACDSIILFISPTELEISCVYLLSLALRWLRVDSLSSWVYVIPWASYQIRKIASCACAGNAGNVFTPPPQFSDPDMHHGMCVTHVPWCMPGSPTGGFLWSRWRGKRSRHSRRIRNQRFCVSVKRPMVWTLDTFWLIVKFTMTPG